LNPSQARGQAATFASYRSDALGVAFQYPTTWQVQESLERRTVTAGDPADLNAANTGGQVKGLLFSVTISSFRQVGTNRTDDFGERLRKAENQPNGAYRQAKIGGAEGVDMEFVDGTSGVGGRVAMLSIGQRRVAVVRGVSTVRGWVREGAAQQMDALLANLTFFPPTGTNRPDQIGVTFWQAADPRFTTFADLAATPDGMAVLATDPVNGIWTVNTAGVVQSIQRYEGPASYGTLALFRDGTQYVSDPVNHVVWLIQPGSTTPKRLLGGTIGAGRGAFGANAPMVFAFGYQNTLNILDVIDSGTRVQVFGRGGDVLTAWNIAPVKDGAITSDALGYIYVVGSNTPGILKIGADGRTVNPALGRFSLINTRPTALAVDRYGAIYVATAEDGILKLDRDGNLAGVIGEPYDEATPPKPGQLGKPTALALSADSAILYVGDSGKYPQIIAVALDGNATVNTEAATVPGDPIATGQTVNGQITSTAFVRTHQFAGTLGTTITITARAATGSPLDLFIDLIGPDGKRLASNDDAKLPGENPLNPQIKAFRLPVTGNFTIRVTRFGRETSTATGAYTVTVEN
jgi:hypothetical protein